MDAPFYLERFGPFQLALRFAAIAERLARRIERRRAKLADQLRRAADSITLNIAEAVGSFSPGKRRQFYRIALGSAHECLAVLRQCVAIGILTTDDIAEARELLLDIIRLVTSMCH